MQTKNKRIEVRLRKISRQRLGNRAMQLLQLCAFSLFYSNENVSEKMTKLQKDQLVWKKTSMSGQVM